MIPDKITKTDLALVLGISRQALEGLEKKGVIRRIGRGMYEFPKAAQDAFAHYREVAAGRASENEDVDLVSERALLAREQRRGHEIKNATLSGELLSARDVQTRWASIMSAIRSVLLAIPSILPGILPHLTRHDIDVIDRTIRDALEKAADESGAD